MFSFSSAPNGSIGTSRHGKQFRERMDISVVLATYNRADSLRATLESLSGLVVPRDLSWELLVVDNNSTDSTPIVVKTFASKAAFPVSYIFEGIQGRSVALNTGIAEAQGEIIVFTDDDVLFDRNWLCDLKETFERHDCEAVAGRVVPLWKQPQPDWLVMEGQFAVVHFEYGDELKEIKDPPLGANSAFRRGVFQRHGFFRSDLGVSGSKHTVTCDDTEFGLRLVRAGERIVYSPTSIVYHPVEPYRATRKYFLTWYYYNGVSLTRTFGVPNEGVFWFGVPRWMVREALTKLAKWQFTWRGNLRFQNKLQFYRSLGCIVESRRLSREVATGAASERALSSRPVVRS